MGARATRPRLIRFWAPSCSNRFSIITLFEEGSLCVLIGAGFGIVVFRAPNCPNPTSTHLFLKGTVYVNRHWIRAFQGPRCANPMFVR